MALTPTPMPWIFKLHDSGEDAEEVYNFVFTGDGFTYAEKEAFATAAREMTANIRDRGPFFFNKDLFNVWAVNSSRMGPKPGQDRPAPASRGIQETWAREPP